MLTRSEIPLDWEELSGLLDGHVDLGGYEDMCE